MQAKHVQIVSGKPGTESANHKFITNREHEIQARVIIEKAGCTKVGGKGNLSLWRLPDAFDQAALQTLLVTVEEAAIQDALALEGAAAAKEAAEAPKEAKEDAVQAATAGDEAVAVTVETQARPMSVFSEMDLGNGYRAGMSNAQRDMCRWPVKPGSIKVGDVIDVNGVKREIVMIGATVHAASDTLKDLNHRFPGVEVVESGDHAFQFAMWRPDPEVFAAPVRPELKVEDDTPMPA